MQRIRRTVMLPIGALLMAVLTAAVGAAAGAGATAGAAAGVGARLLSHSPSRGAESYRGPDSYSVGGSSVPGHGTSSGGGSGMRWGMTTLAFGAASSPAPKTASASVSASGSLNGHSRPHSSHSSSGSGGSPGDSSSYHSSSAAESSSSNPAAYDSQKTPVNGANEISEGEYRAILASLKAVEAYSQSRSPNAYQIQQVSNSGASNGETYSTNGVHGTSSVSVSAGYRVGGHGDSSSSVSGSTSSYMGSPMAGPIYGTPATDSHGSAEFTPSSSSGYSPGAREYSSGGSEYSPGAREYSPGPSGYNSGSNGYSSGASGYSSEASGYSPGTTGYSPESGGHSPGSSGFASGSGGYSSGHNGYSSGSNGFSPVSSLYSPGSGGYSTTSGGYSSDYAVGGAGGGGVGGGGGGHGSRFVGLLKSSQTEIRQPVPASGYELPTAHYYGGHAAGAYGLRGIGGVSSGVSGGISGGLSGGYGGAQLLLPQGVPAHSAVAFSAAAYGGVPYGAPATSYGPPLGSPQVTQLRVVKVALPSAPAQVAVPGPHHVGMGLLPISYKPSPPVLIAKRVPHRFAVTKHMAVAASRPYATYVPVVRKLLRPVGHH